MAAFLVLSAVAGPPVAVASDPEESFVVPGDTLAAATADLDADGSGDVVRISDGTSSDYVVEQWSLIGDSWERVGSAELAAPRNAGGSPSDPQLAALLQWRLDGRDRVLAVTAVSESASDTYPTPCCLTISLVEGAGDDLALARVGSDGGGELIQSVDMDGDGTDEVVTYASIFTGEAVGAFRLEVLHWSGDRFEPLFEIDRDEPTYGFVVGDSDGVAGTDIVLRPTMGGDLERLTLRGGRVEREEADLDVGERGEAYLFGAADGTLLVQDARAVRAVEWPRGSRPTTRATLPADPGTAVTIVGDPGRPFLLVYRIDPFYRGPAVSPTESALYTLDLELLGDLPNDELGSRVSEVLTATNLYHTDAGRNLWTFMGSLPGPEGDGRSQVLLSGTLVELEASGRFETRQVMPLIGTMPIGAAGPDDAWIATSDGGSGSGSEAWLSAFGYDAAPNRLVLTPMALLRQPPNASSTSIGFQDAVAVDAPDRVSHLFARGDGFQATVDAPPGSIVLVSGPGLNDIFPVADVEEVGTEPVVVEILPRRNAPDDENIDFERSVLIIGADGRATLEEWRGTFLRQTPGLTADAATEQLAFASALTGRTDPWASVTVDGRPVSVGAGGRFSVRLDAPPWPRDVIVVARDPFGAEHTMVVQVIGFLDYRGLPWIPIFAALTVAAAAFLFLRAPRAPRRRDALRPQSADGTLEEIDAG